MLRIEHLSKAYGEKKAVDDLNLHIAPGEIYGFIGHNGAGKTTTLKSVAGILQFDQGEIYVDGKSIKADPIGCKKVIAYIPDNPDLYEFMSGVKYLNFIADVYGVSKTDRIAPVVANTNVNYRAPIIWPNNIVVELYVERLGNASVTIAHRIVDEKDASVLYSDGNVVVVWMDTQTGRSAPLPEAVRQASQ